jgi:hypothetical protein
VTPLVEATAAFGVKFREREVVWLDRARSIWRVCGADSQQLEALQWAAVVGAHGTLPATWLGQLNETFLLRAGILSSGQVCQPAVLGGGHCARAQH